MMQTILATWRLTSLIHRERGPADIFDRFRHALGVRHDEEGAMYPTTNLAEGVLCFWCCSVWGGAAVGLLAALTGKVKWKDLPMIILAASAGAIVLETLLEGDH